MKTSEEFLSVSELNNYIRDVVNSGFPAALWVCGEVQELRDKKHLYFTLSEKDPESNAITAKIGATIWANSRSRIDAILQKAENAFVLKDDIEVKLLCKVDFYPPFGQVRLIVEGIDPTYTLGKIAQDRQRLITTLKQKGILDKNKQVEMPRLPLFVGLITSHESAAYHDFVAELRKSSYTFHVKLVDCIMQGKTSEVSVSKAIKLLNQREDIDVIVITRGGGSITDLSCFDSQMIAEAIAASRFPVLSGIGHEINTTITDLAAHTFTKTPTAAARHLIGRVEEFLSHLQEKQEFLFNLLENTLNERRQSIKHQAITLRQSTMGLIHHQQNILARMRETFKRLPSSLIKESKKQSQQRAIDLKRTIHLHLQTSKTKIQTYQKLIDVADPRNTLKRGFSITRDSKGKAIKSIKNLKVSTITTQLSDGIMTSIVETIKEG